MSDTTTALHDIERKSRNARTLIAKLEQLIAAARKDLDAGTAEMDCRDAWMEYHSTANDLLVAMASRARAIAATSN